LKNKTIAQAPQPTKLKYIKLITSSWSIKYHKIVKGENLIFLPQKLN
jgi:hypothetical protein